MERTLGAGLTRSRTQGTPQQARASDAGTYAAVQPASTAAATAVYNAKLQSSCPRRRGPLPAPSLHPIATKIPPVPPLGCKPLSDWSFLRTAPQKPPSKSSSLIPPSTVYPFMCLSHHPSLLVQCTSSWLSQAFTLASLG